MDDGELNATDKDVFPGVMLVIEGADGAETVYRTITTPEPPGAPEPPPVPVPAVPGDV